MDVMRRSDEPSGFWRDVPCGHPPDPVAAMSLDDDPVPVCHCGWGLDPAEAISDGYAEGAPGPIVPCAKCGCYVAVPSARVGVRASLDQWGQ